jgi:hypothetical protein
MMGGDSTMKALVRAPVIAAILALSPAPLAAETLKVVASILDMADIAAQIGGDKVDAYALSTGMISLLRPRPMGDGSAADLLIVGIGVSSESEADQASRIADPVRGSGSSDGPAIQVPGR